MNRERGVSSLAMVLLLLVTGGLLLQGTNQQERSYASRVAMEIRALERQAVVQSAMEWGRRQRWARQTEKQCRIYGTENARVCLRLLAENQVLLIASYEGATLWRRGEDVEGNILFTPHGWSDFCPLQEAALCQLP